MNEAAQRPRLKWHVLSDGYTEATEAIAWPLGSWRKKLRFYATAFLLDHPDHGLILVDTGYSSRFFDVTSRGWGRIHRWLTPVTLTNQEGIAGCLKKRGIEPHSIRHLVITHFHVDHIGGLKDFPQAALYCSKTGWQEINGLAGFKALRHGYFPELVPDDFEARVTFISEGQDPFSDGSLRIYDLPGHAVGQIGVEFTSEEGRDVLLAADACWLSEAYRQRQPPHAITRLLHDAEAYHQSLRRLNQWHHDRPDLQIVPTHCPETASLIMS